MAKREGLLRESGEVDLVLVPPESDVVSEPGRELRRFRNAADHRERDHVVERVAPFCIEPHAVAEASRDEPRAQNVLHGLPETEVACQ